MPVTQPGGDEDDNWVLPTPGSGTRRGGGNQGGGNNGGGDGGGDVGGGGNDDVLTLEDSIASSRGRSQGGGATIIGEGAEEEV